MKTGRLWQKELPALHYLFAVLVIIGAILTHVSDMQKGEMAYDFYVYHSAGLAARLEPEALYSDKYFKPPYQEAAPFNTVEAEKLGSYVNPPSFAVLLAPLSYFTYLHAYLAWIALTLLCTAYCWRQTGRLASGLEIPKYKNLMMSLLAGNLAFYSVLLNGQVSMLLCALLYTIIIYQQKDKLSYAALPLACLTAIKPHLFLPLLCMFLGMRHYRFLGHTIGWGIAIFVLSILMLGLDSWWQFYLHVTHVNAEAEGNWSAYPAMMNLRGLLSSLLGDTNHQSVSYLTYVLYSAFLPAAYFLGRSSKDFLPTLSLTFMAGAFFSPWLHYNDAVLLVPCAVITLAQLHKREAMGWMLIPYAFLLLSLATSFMLQIYELIRLDVWLHRLIFYSLLAISIVDRILPKR